MRWPILKKINNEYFTGYKYSSLFKSTADVSGFVNFINNDNSLLYLSVVSEAEIRSLAIRKKWGVKKLDFLDGFFKIS